MFTPRLRKIPCAPIGAIEKGKWHRLSGRVDGGERTLRTFRRASAAAPGIADSGGYLHHANACEAVGSGEIGDHIWPLALIAG
jgi:hypothetical protein